MILSTFDFISGIMSNIILIIGILASISIISKYITTKKRDFLLLGITVIVLVEPWMPSAISFIHALFNYGEPIPVFLYIFIGNAFIPVGLIMWAIVFTDLILVEKQKIIVSFVVIFSIIFEIHLLLLLFTNNTHFLGSLVGATDIEYHYFLEISLAIVLVYIFITGITFGIETMRTDDPDLKLKGKLMIAGFSTFVLFASIDAIITFNEIILILIRLLGIFSAFALYSGFLLPKWLKKLLRRMQ